MRNPLVSVALVGCFALLGAAPAVSQQVRPALASEISVPLRDARSAGAGSVRFSAAQLTKTAPVIVLFGATTPTWHKARAGIQQAIYEGFPISGVIMGPSNEPPSLEVYAQGHLVTKPINLDRISQSEITRLLRDISREYFGR